MRSRAESRARVAAEGVARALAFALLAFALWRVVQALLGGDDAVPRLHVRLDAGVTAVQRDSLAALARAGHEVTWSGDLRSLAAMTEPVREPAAGWRISVVADSASRLTDALGALDSLGAGGGAVRAAGVRGDVAAHEGTTAATVGAPGEVTLGRVLVYSRAGWEAKFVIAALEEQGWVVDARLRLGREVAVTQGPTGGPTIARHAAVVVLDTAVGGDAGAITRFVRAGGGLVLAGEGAGAPSLRGIAPARVVRVEPPETRSFQGDHHPTHALPLHALGGLRAEGALLESRDDIPAVAARRLGAGRVVQVGYAETWRWRMQGEGRSVEEHRTFWSRLVGAAAAASPSPEETRVAEGDAAVAGARGSARAIGGTNAAPLAQTIHALGPSSAPPPGREGAPRGPLLPPWLAPLTLGLLVAEWGSRRTRGAK